ncbi:MAG: dihydropteroate synthase [Firmicutes bacterium]|nr:dihydropteroate synthase [Bacillota bacterium]
MLVIGELINAARQSVKKAVINQDALLLQELARKQDEAGAHYIDINVATGEGREADSMDWAVKLVREVTQKPLCIDTTNEKVLKAGLKAHGPGAMVNSVNAEEGRLEPFLKLAAEHECLVIVLPVSDAGIPKDTDTRLKIGGEILKVAQKESFPPENLYFDPLALPLAVDNESGKVTLQTLRLFKKELGVKTTIGLSNISHGLPQRKLLNRTFLALAMWEGLDSAIMDPLDDTVISSLLTTKAFMGRDPYCGKYLRAYRNGRLIT